MADQSILDSEKSFFGKNNGKWNSSNSRGVINKNNSVENEYNKLEF
jgi:hypothetical protein